MLRTDRRTPEIVVAIAVDVDDDDEEVIDVEVVVREAAVELVDFSLISLFALLRLTTGSLQYFP